jgi:hypothetical protein
MNPREGEQSQFQGESSRFGAKDTSRKQTVAVVVAFAVGVLLTAGTAIGVAAFYAGQSASSSVASAPTTSPPPSPAAGTYWFNSSFSGTAAQEGGGCVTAPSQCTPLWIDFNVTCPTGNMNLTGTWSNAAGFPTMVRMSVNGTVLATSGGDVPWYGTANASSGSFHLIAHGTVEFRMLSAWDMSQEIYINGERQSYSVIL